MKKLSISIVSILVVSMLIVGPVCSASWTINLPTDPVTLVVNEVSTYSFFLSTLSNVPVGFDVSNRVYAGWCVDLRYDIPQDPVTHSVTLFSSVNPPEDFEDEEWDMVNYILNNRKGTALDVQYALWYFVRMDGASRTWFSYEGYVKTAEAQAMVDDALANGEGFTPGPKDVVAVICVPETETQITIIELCKGTGKVTGGGQIPIDDGKASFGFNAMWFSRNEYPKGELQYVDHVTGDKVHAHDLDYLIVWMYNEGNKPEPMRFAYFRGPCTFNHEPGYYFECLVEDDKEPGKADAFSLLVYRISDNVVVIKEGDTTNTVPSEVTLLHGNIQIHKSPQEDLNTQEIISESVSEKNQKIKSEIKGLKKGQSKQETKLKKK